MEPLYLLLQALPSLNTGNRDIASFSSQAACLPCHRAEIRALAKVYLVGSTVATGGCGNKVKPSTTGKPKLMCSPPRSIPRGWQLWKVVFCAVMS